MTEPEKKRKPNAYILALKEFNKGKTMWCIPKKGSEDHKEVTRLKEKIMKGEKIEHVQEKVKKIEERVSEITNYAEKKYEEISGYEKKLDAEKWAKLSEQQKRGTMRMIIEDLPQYAKALKKKNPYPTKKSLPKYMHEAYEEFKKSN